VFSALSALSTFPRVAQLEKLVASRAHPVCGFSGPQVFKKKNKHTCFSLARGCISNARRATMSPFVNAPPERASNRAPEKVRAKTAVAVPRGPITRRQHSLANKREENEKRSLLLKLNDDLLEKVLSFLPGRELASMETVCTHFRYGGWLAANKAPMPEVSAKRKLDALELGDMPPGFKYVSHYYP
jgi:hypothetical protein